jgi:hypothetical protein
MFIKGGLDIMLLVYVLLKVDLETRIWVHSSSLRGYPRKPGEELGKWTKKLSAVGTRIKFY